MMNSHLRSAFLPKRSPLLWLALLAFSALSNSQASENALRFNDASSLDQRVVIPTNAVYTATNPFTLQLWLRRLYATAPTVYEHLVSRDNNIKTAGWALEVQPNSALLRFELFGVTPGIISNTPILDTNWHHVAVTRDSGGTMNIYIDGVLDSSMPNVPAPIAAAVPLKFGNSDSGANGFEGEIDEVQFWNFNRTGSSILSTRRLPLTGNETGLIGYWNLNEGTGQLVADKSPTAASGFRGISTSNETQDPTWFTANVPFWGNGFDGTAPTVTILNPANDSYPNISSLSMISGTSSDNLMVQTVLLNLQRMSDGWFWNPTSQSWVVATTTIVANGTSLWSFYSNTIAWSAGTYFATAHAIDIDNNMTTAISSFTIPAAGDTTPPSTYIYQPASNFSYVDSALLTMSGGASDDTAVSSVKVRITRLSDNLDWNGNTVSWVPGPINNSANGTTIWNYTVPISAWVQPGNYSITVTAYDAANNQTPSSRNFSIQGAVDDALRFNYGVQTQQRATVPSQTYYDANNSFTIEFWLRRNTAGVPMSDEYLVAKDNPNKTSGWTLILKNGSGLIRFEPLGVGGGLTSNVAILDTAWHHFAITRSNSGFTQMYIDGNFDASSNTNAPGVNTYPLKFGNSENISNDYHGDLDEVQFWNFDRIGGDIRCMRRLPLSGYETGLSGYWNLNESGGQALTDKSQNHNDGYLGTTTSGDPQDAFRQQPNIPNWNSNCDSNPPTGKILSPVNSDSLTVLQMANINGTAQDNETGLLDVRLTIMRTADGYYWNRLNQLWSPTYIQNPVDGTTSWTFPGNNVLWTPGSSYFMTMQARDQDGNIRNDYSSFSVIADTETTPPTVDITSLVFNSSYTDSQLTLLSGTANDNNAVARIDVKITRLSDNLSWNANSVSWISGTPVNVANGLYNWQLTMPISAWSQAGAYTMSATAYDTSNNFSTANKNFYVVSATAPSSGDSIAPTVQVIFPAAGSSHSSSALAVLNGTSDDNSGYTEVKVSLQDLTGGKYWNGTAFNSSTENEFVLSPSRNWSYSVPSTAWISGRTYRLNVKVRDANNNLTTTLSDFMVDDALNTDTVPPYINIVSPTDGSVATPSTLLISGNAGDDTALSSVQINIKQSATALYYNGVSFAASIPTSLTANGLAAWNYNLPVAALSNGAYLLQATAKDAAGNIQTKTVTFTISGGSNVNDSVAPTGSIIVPAAGTTYTSASALANLSGTATDDTQLAENLLSINDDQNKYFDGNAWVAINPVYFNVGVTYNWQTAIPISAWKNGVFTAHLQLRDSANNITTLANQFTITGISGGGVVDTLPPQNIINNPGDGTSAQPYSYSALSGHADDPSGISNVVLSIRNVDNNLYYNGATFSSGAQVRLFPGFTTTVSGLDWTYNVPANVYVNGNYLITVEATDLAGNKSTKNAGFNVFGANQGAGDTVAPSLSINSFANNSTKTSLEMTNISGNANDNSNLDHISLEIQNAQAQWWNGTGWQSTVYMLTAVGLQNWSLALPLSMWTDGTYSVRARAYDIAGNTTQILNNLTISGLGTVNLPPNVSITSISPGQTYLPSTLAMFNGTTDGASIRTRITDMNLNLNWDPVRALWVSETVWSNGNVTGGTWSSFNSPSYWPNGHFKLTVEATSAASLISVTEADFYVSISSGNSNVDFTPPSAIALTAEPGTLTGSVKLSWTSPGDDGAVGTATAYAIKYSLAPINNEADWTAASDVSFYPVNQTPPAPLVAGTSQTMNVLNLTPGVAYFWGIRATDDNFNRSVLSNSPVAIAFSGCVAGLGDGEGTATVSPSSLPSSTETPITLTYTVGAHGITDGGRINIRVPDGFMPPQIFSPTTAGYVSAVTSNSGVTLTRELDGPVIKLRITGTLNAGDTITVSYRAKNYSCTLQSGLAFTVLSQATSCGVPTAIASQPNVSLVAGPAAWLGFDNVEKFAPTAQVVAFAIRGQNICGELANASASISIQTSVVVWDNTTYTYVADPDATLSLSSDLSGPFSNGNVTLSNGQSTVPLYYRLNVNDTREHRVRIQYLDINSQSYTTENSMKMVPVTAGQGISQATIDKGQTGNLTSVTFSPPSEIVYINYQTAANVSSVVKIKQGSTLIQQLWGYGSPVRLAWNGDQTTANSYGTAPSGTYSITIEAAGQQDTSLSVTLQTVGTSGVIQDTNNSPVANANVSIYGPVSRMGQTDNSGAFSFNGIPAGAYTLHIEKYGYATKDVSFNFGNSNLNLGNVTINALSKIIVNATRDNTASDLWGSVRTIDPTTQQETWTSLHFAYGLTTANNGINTDKPEILLKSGIAYQVNLAIPGFTVSPLSKTLAPAETYTWNVAMTAKKGVSGSIVLANSIPNPTGMWIAINGVRGTDTLPTKFTSAFIPAGESQTSYLLPDLEVGTYKLTFTTPGLSPTSANITMANADIIQNVTMSLGGNATFTLAFQGDTTALDLKDGFSDGKFPVTLRYATDNANGVQTIYLNTNPTSTSLTTTLTGMANGTYKIYFDAIDGFTLNTASPQLLTVTANAGTLNSTFVQNSGVLVGTVALPNGVAMNNLAFYLTRDTTVRTTPTINGNQFTFNYLASGKYSLTVFNTLNSTSKSLDVFVANAQTTNISIDLTAVQTYSVSGTVRTLAAPPKDSLVTIDSNSTPLSFYTASGQVTVPALSVLAQLILPDGSVSALPTAAGAVLDPAKLKYGSVNTGTGVYQIDGLEKGKSYRIGLNTDLDGDGKSDIPRNDIVLSPTANQSGVDFTIRDGGKIQVTLGSPNSESGYGLTLDLVDADRKVSIQRQAVSMVGTSATLEFANLQSGRYLVSATDNNTPVKYTVTPQFVTLENITTTKAISMTLVESGRVQVTLATRYGTLITSANESSLLPANTKVKIASRTQNLIAQLDASDGKYKAAIQPGIDYTMIIEPPADLSANDADKAFLPIQKNVRIDNSGAVLDFGVIVLEAGDEVSGSVSNESNSAVARVPVLAYQSLAPTITPLKVYTDDQGKFKFTNLSQKVRFYDLVANPIGDTDSLPTYSEIRKTSLDLSKPELLSNLTITLPAAHGGIKGRATSTGALLAGYGDKAGQPGVSVLITSRINKRVFELLSNPDGTFSVSLPAGSYDVEVIAQSYQPRLFANQTVSDSVLDLGDIQLSNVGVSVAGKIRTVDGSLPVADQVTDLVAIDSLKNRYRAALSKVSNGTLTSIDSYAFYGLSPNTSFDIIALDKNRRAKILKKALLTSNIDSSFDLTYSVTEPTLYANFILKIPEKDQIDLRIGCNQTFRNKDTDADGNGIADDQELDKFLSVASGNGSMVGNSFSADRYSANYTYTLGDETGISALTVNANFHTSEIDPKTGDNFSVTGQFSQPYGILSQNTNPISKTEGGTLTLTNGASVSIPANALESSNDEDIVVKLQQTEDVATASELSASANPHPRAAALISRANHLGASAYPTGIYKAIKAMESLPTVNPLASFYDIFLPAGISHVFGNGYKPTLTLKYDANADPTQINIYYFNEAQNVYTLENNNRLIDPINHLISVDVGHFSVFTVLASSAPVIRSNGYAGELDVFNFPNPFDLNQKTVTLQNPGAVSSTQLIHGTMIKIDIPSSISGDATIKIFDMAGERVRTLHADNLTPQTHNYVEWDGTNDHGAQVASGVYIGRLEVGSQARTFKMAVVK